MSGSVLHKKHKPYHFLNLELLPFVFHAWNMVYCKLQINGLYLIVDI